MEFNAKEFTEQAVVFIKDYLKKEGLGNKVVIGLSGGIDSAVVYNILVRALGADNVIPIMLPNSSAGDSACDWAIKVAAEHKIVPQKVDIGPAVAAIAETLDAKNDPVRMGNIAARARMIVLMDQAKKEKAIVAGTENKTEHYLGYFTIGGDEVSNIELIRDLYKTQVRELARYLGVPQGVIDKPPTADLWQGQTDEEELGITYEEADKIIEAVVDKEMDKTQLLELAFDTKKVDIVVGRMNDIKFKIADKPFPHLG